MKIASIVLVMAGTLAMAAPILATPAAAEVVNKSVSYRGGPFHGCKTVRVVKTGGGVRRVAVRKICH